MPGQSKSKWRLCCKRQSWPRGLAPYVSISRGALWHADVFIPKIWMLRDEAAHHLHTFRIVENCERDSGLSKQVFRPEKIAVLADDDRGNAEEQRRPRAHDARAEGAYEREWAPVAAASGIA